MIGSETRPQRNPLFTHEANTLPYAGRGVVVEGDFTADIARKPAFTDSGCLRSHPVSMVSAPSDTPPRMKPRRSNERSSDR